MRPVILENHFTAKKPVAKHKDNLLNGKKKKNHMTSTGLIFNT